MKCYIAKKEQVVHDWKLVDADDKILGRLACKIAPILMGKTKPTYTPHVDPGDYVVVINAEKIRVSGNKADTKEYQSYSGYPGGQKIKSFADMMESQPEKVIMEAVRRMLPKSKLGRVMLSKLKVFRGAEHTHAAQNPEKVEL
jgi:large subunit ribosomal protein L13